MSKQAYPLPFRSLPYLALNAAWISWIMGGVLLETTSTVAPPGTPKVVCLSLTMKIFCAIAL